MYVRRQEPGVFECENCGHKPTCHADHGEYNVLEYQRIMEAVEAADSVESPLLHARIHTSVPQVCVY